MRIAMDATPLLGTRTGVGTFTLGAMNALGRRGDLDIVGYALSWRARAQLRASLPAGIGLGRCLPAALALPLWKRTDLLGAEFLAAGVDVIHGTNFVVPPSKRAASVVTVHDLTAVRFPHLCTPASLRYPGLIRRAAHAGAWIHTPSAFVAAEVCELLGVRPDRVRAVAHGVGLPQDGADPTDARAGAAAGRRLAGSERYILALGTIEPRKDYPLLVEAFDEIADRRPDLRLVIAGSPGWGAEALERGVDASRARDRIVRVGYVDCPTRLALLAGATVFAFPSVYEGFGLPPLEAMAAGVPVVATAAGAVVEVVGDAARVVAVGDRDGLAAALAEVIDDEATAEALIARGRLRAAGFTWERCAGGMAELYGAAAATRRSGRASGQGR